MEFRPVQGSNGDAYIKLIALINMNGVWLFRHFSVQVNFSVRYLQGFGLTDGEGTERLWSYLRPLSVVTKEMTPVHRLEVLNDALLHFCERKTANLGILILPETFFFYL